jgi:DNA polymerase V
MRQSNANDERSHALPFVLSHVHAGFPSPADDYAEHTLHLDSLVIQHPAASFYVKVSGDSMRDAGISEGDILVVDQALEATHNTVIVAMLNGEFTIKRLSLHNGQITLAPANPRYHPILITEGMDFQVWGVVTYCIRRVR